MKQDGQHYPVADVIPEEFFQALANGVIFGALPRWQKIRHGIMALEIPMV
jgi:hypothetical protein